MKRVMRILMISGISFILTGAVTGIILYIIQPETVLYLLIPMFLGILGLCSLVGVLVYQIKKKHTK